ncbi:MAG: GPW/gp25 family protein [Methanosarcina sp.]|uniref:GPW/gp25 family protein n=1 Tax=Methanosarcina sp. TaxID=2213 RepID=UPI0026233635|nr:GPW/gp25 family protein [Methanosarcina sp.]MDD3246392.1 GPW/gp25 family protein [Methanosarcina sp.]MDD4247786.1 GPW/gp25 family protein [Methanosarcina sp.]
MEKEFLGIGWKYPVGVEADGSISRSSYEENIRESILLILGTAKGERLMRPEFGCSIHDYAYSTMDTLTRRMIENSVYEALVAWEPRIEVNEIKALTEKALEGKLLISIDYKVRRSNTQVNLVYPFYLKEGI